MEKKPLLNSEKSVSCDQKDKEGPSEAGDVTHHQHDQVAPSSSRPWQHWTKRQVVPALSLMAGGFLGMMTSKTIGPSLLDLQLRTGTSIEQVSWYISAQAIGSMAGAMLLGKVIELPSRWLQLSTSLLLSGAVFSVIPWFTVYWAQMLFFVLYGVCMGYALTGCQLTTYSLFDNRVDSVSWQNMYQILLSIGGLFGPLVVKPFLLETSLENSTTDGLINATITGPSPDDVTIMYGFLIPGSLLVLVAVISFIIHFAFGGITVNTSSKKLQASPDTILPRRLQGLRIALIVLLVVYYSSQAIFLRTYDNYLVPFTVGHLSWTKSQGADLASAFFATAIVGKVFVIFIIRCVSIEAIIFTGLVICNISAAALAFLMDFHYSVIWIFTILLSFGTCLPVCVLFAWTDKYIGLKGFVGILYSASGSVGGIAFNPVIGYLFQNVSYISLMYLVLTSTAVCLVIMIVLEILGRQYLKAAKACESQ